MAQCSRCKAKVGCSCSLKNGLCAACKAIVDAENKPK